MAKTRAGRCAASTAQTTDLIRCEGPAATTRPAGDSRTCVCAIAVSSSGVSSWTSIPVAARSRKTARPARASVIPTGRGANPSFGIRSSREAPT